MGVLHTEDIVDLVCQHHDGYWNAVSADPFGEQTAIRIGKGVLKGMKLSGDLVSELIAAFPIPCVRFSRPYLFSLYTRSDFTEAL